MRIDSHQHFWKYDPEQYPWITEKLAILKRDYLPEHLEPELRRQHLDGCIAVQARQTLEESRWLLSLATKSPIIKGVVGWVDLRSSRVEDQLAELAPNPLFRGVRHVLQDEPDDNFALRPDFQNGISKLHGFNLTYDLLIFPKQLPAAIQLVRNFPQQPFVLDHIAKPHIKVGTFEPWATHIRELAHSPNVTCKISGLVTEAAWHTWQESDFRPYLDLVFETFTPARLMFGSDWPVALLASDYSRLFQIADNYTRALSESERTAIFGGTAARFYGLDQTDRVTKG